MLANSGLIDKKEDIVGSVVHTMARSLIILVVCSTACAAPPRLGELVPTSVQSCESTWQEEFGISECTLVSTGRNRYFILEPGFQLVLEGGREVLTITVLDETVDVDGIQTRVVEEREWRNGDLIEVSRNFFAMCEKTEDVFCFGEEVDMYSGGKLASHSGAWRAGERNAKPGLIMPGNPRLGMQYYQEIAPGVAMDRAEIVSLDETLTTPAGSFSKSLKTREGTALNPAEREFKTYAPGIGLIQDQNLLLAEYGSIKKE
jgi:hypothetical protein